MILLLFKTQNKWLKLESAQGIVSFGDYRGCYLSHFLIPDPQWCLVIANLLEITASSLSTFGD